MQRQDAVCAGGLAGDGPMCASCKRGELLHGPATHSGGGGPTWCTSCAAARCALTSPARRTRNMMGGKGGGMGAAGCEGLPALAPFPCFAMRPKSPQERGHPQYTRFADGARNLKGPVRGRAGNRRARKLRLSRWIAPAARAHAGAAAAAAAGEAAAAMATGGEDTMQQYLLLAKGARGRTLVELISRATAEPSLFAFGELLDVPGVAEVRRPGYPAMVPLKDLPLSVWIAAA
eukprot:364170-Chlamydomonas_euryale.AAC.7